MPKTPSPKPDIRLDSPADLLSAVPYLLGYAPADTIVVIGMSKQTIAVTLGAPLPARSHLDAPPPISPQALLRSKVVAAIVIGYGPPGRVTACVDVMRRALRAAHITVTEAMRVTEGRFWSYTCEGTRCCPPQGTPLNPPSSEVDVAFTVNGVQSLPSREAVVAQLEPVRGRARATITRATNRIRRALSQGNPLLPPHVLLRNEGTTILARVVEPEAALPDVDDTIRLGMALGDPKLRTAALVAIDEAGAQRTVPIWLWLTRHVAPAFRAVPAALLGYAAWRCGNGVLAGEAVRRALTDDPHCQLATLMLRILDLGLPPSSLPKLSASADAAFPLGPSPPAVAMVAVGTGVVSAVALPPPTSLWLGAMRHGSRVPLGCLDATAFGRHGAILRAQVSCPPQCVSVVVSQGCAGPGLPALPAFRKHPQQWEQAEGDDGPESPFGQVSFRDVESLPDLACPVGEWPVWVHQPEAECGCGVGVEDPHVHGTERTWLGVTMDRHEESSLLTVVPWLE
ncbi:MAG TPA: DUF4192 domain-containing protein [Stackebrandtia sp.]|jgi:hypothetical protein|uniref:DUF4192 domain-containing protein n=1 Tax=Stackebrandtia sp. TaxID=2023065 RepID=UPI002D255EC3|nr:DUF4192 domain-containing protein [Stackebrandtia sp.]HZE41068.1 DUF4192 domain-containing protein [Stackebrandtia sp.]